MEVTTRVAQTILSLPEKPLVKTVETSVPKPKVPSTSSGTGSRGLSLPKPAALILYNPFFLSKTQPWKI
jgi:hypothetical protein